MNLFVIRSKWFGLSMLLGLTAACSESMVPVEVTGYNHTSDQGILGFSVNGASGPNLFPESGGGKSMCCIEIPKHWKSGMKARVKWTYGSGGPGTPPAPPPQETTIEIPEYTPHNLGSVQVHFYADHRIKVVVSRHGIESPCGPLTEEEKAPWSTQPEIVSFYTQGGGKGERCDGLRSYLDRQAK